HTDAACTLSHGWYLYCYVPLCSKDVFLVSIKFHIDMPDPRFGCMILSSHLNCYMSRVPLYSVSVCKNRPRRKVYIRSCQDINMSVDTSTCIPAAGIRHLIVHDDLQPRFAPKSNKWGQVSMERCVSIRVAFHEVTVAVDLSIHIRPVYLQKDALVFQV